MNKNNILWLCIALLCSGCATEFNRVYKLADNTYKYEYAKECFARGKYQQAATLLQELVTSQKGRNTAQEGLYMLGMAQYGNQSWQGSLDYL